MKKMEKAFIKMCNYYNDIFVQYYPSHGGNGFTERNLTFNISHNYLSLNEKAIVWQEAPILRKEHFDTLIIDKESNEIYFIEAKRLQNDNKKEQLLEDYNRIIDRWKEINRHKEFLDYKKYAILLADIWIPANSLNKSQLKNDFNILVSDNNLIFHLSKRIETVPSEDEYWLLCNCYSF